MGSYRKQLPEITYTEFISRAGKVKKFTSSQGKRYEVDGLMNDVLFFRRMDAGGSDWDMDLKKLYEGYLALEDFSTENFRPFVAQRHSPGRGLLLHLGLIG
jgi:hypothetical protein